MYDEFGIERPATRPETIEQALEPFVQVSATLSGDSG